MYLNKTVEGLKNKHLGFPKKEFSRQQHRNLVLKNSDS